MRSNRDASWLILIVCCLSICNLAAQSQSPNIPGVSVEDQQSIESACSTDKYLFGPRAYHDCVDRQMRALSGSKSPNISGLSMEDQQSIESACSTDKYLFGPRAYHDCLDRQLRALSGSKSPNISGLSIEDRQSIESACSTDKYLFGPRAYHDCVDKQLRALSGFKNPATAQRRTKGESPSVLITPTVPRSAGSGLCAENGSCYGDLNANGVPKTVHVDGYYRNDGTYVRGHYRSAPGTNPRKWA